MKLLQNQVHREKLKQTPDNALISKLESIINRGTLTFGEFSDGSVKINVGEYKSSNPNAELNIDCNAVVKYYGDFIIQELNDRSVELTINNKQIRCRNLENAEEILWDKLARKSFPQTKINAKKMNR